MEKKRISSVFLNGILTENPTFRLVLGTCPTMAVTTSAINGIGMGLGFTLAITLIGMIRELLGNGSLFGFRVFGTGYQPMLLMILPAGGFIVYGLLLWAINMIVRRIEQNRAQKEA